MCQGCSDVDKQGKCGGQPKSRVQCFSPRLEHDTNSAVRRQRNELSEGEEHSKREKEHKQICTNGHMAVSIASISSKGRGELPCVVSPKTGLAAKKEVKTESSPAEDSSWSSGGLSGRES